MIGYIITVLHLFFWTVYASKKYKVFFNPISLFTTSLNLSIVSVYFGDIFGLLRGFEIDVTESILLIFNIATISFVLPWVSLKQFQTDRFYLKRENNLKIKTLILILASLIFTIIAFYFLGSIPFIDMFFGKLNIVEYNELIKSLPLGLLSILLLLSTLLSLVISTFFSRNNIYKYSPLTLSIILFIALFLSIWQGKRQGILMLLFFIIARFFQGDSLLKVRKVTFKVKAYIASALILFITLFSSIGRIRHNNDVNDYFELLSYTIYPIMNFSGTVSDSSGMGSSIFPYQTLSGFLPRRVLESNPNFEINLSLFEPSSPSGYFNSWYIDYGYFGIILGSLILSVVAKYFFSRRFVSENNMRRYILTIWCCATVGIYNHFLTLNYFLIPLIGLIFFQLTFKYVK